MVRSEMFSFTLQDLAYLDLLARAGSYGLAAKTAGCGKSTVRSAISRLSALAGAPAWDGCLTDAGEELLSRARPLLEQAAELQKAYGSPAVSRGTGRSGKVTPTELKIVSKVLEQAGGDMVMHATDAALALSIGSTARTVGDGIDELARSGIVRRVGHVGVKVLAGLRADGPIERLEGSVPYVGMPIAPVAGGAVGVVLAVYWSRLAAKVRFPGRDAATVGIDELLTSFGKVEPADLRPLATIEEVR